MNASIDFGHYLTLSIKIAWKMGDRADDLHSIYEIGPNDERICFFFLIVDIRTRTIAVKIAQNPTEIAVIHNISRIYDEKRSSSKRQLAQRGKKSHEMKKNGDSQNLNSN